MAKDETQQIGIAPDWGCILCPTLIVRCDVRCRFFLHHCTMILSLQCFNDLRQPVPLLLPRIAMSSEKSLNSASSNSEEPSFYCWLLLYNWFAFTPGYFGRILTRSIAARCMDQPQPQKMICPGISSLELARRTQERASPIRTGTVHFAHGDCFDDRFCSRPMREVRISSKHWRQWWNIINDDQQRIMLRMLCMLFHSISSSGSTGESTPKSGWEKGLGTQVLTNGALHHSTFQFVFCDQARREKERHDLSMSEFIQRRQTQNPKKSKLLRLLSDDLPAPWRMAMSLVKFRSAADFLRMNWKQNLYNLIWNDAIL